MDRLDVQFAASFLGRATSRPTVHSMAALKRVARHLLKHPSMQFEYWLTPISEASVLEGCSDSDRAGCLTTSGSMSGGVRTSAGCAVKSWSNRQDSVALSSGKAEYYACVKAAAELMGNGFGVERWSTGKVRHLEVGHTRTLSSGKLVRR